MFLYFHLLDRLLEQLLELVQLRLVVPLQDLPVGGVDVYPVEVDELIP